MIANKTINNIPIYILSNCVCRCFSSQFIISARKGRRENLPLENVAKVNNRTDDSDGVIREMINYILNFHIFRNCKLEELLSSSSLSSLALRAIKE